jgi:hypothetical protein
MFEEEHTSIRIGERNEGESYSSFLELAEEKDMEVVVGTSTANSRGRGRREGDNKGMTAA